MPMIGVNPDFDYLYDPQQAQPYAFCNCCGGEIYRPFTDTCDTCLMDMELNND